MTEFKLISTTPSYLNHWYRLVGKEIFDRVIGAVLFVLLLPIVATIGIITRIALGPKILFIQQRAGENGKVFNCLKFRTMKPERRKAASSAFMLDRRTGLPAANDPRHTSWGTFLRRYGLDELPQLINVIKGEMSLVGPRPEIAEIFLKYNEKEKQRLLVKPGLTGYWQITRRSDAIDLRTFADVDIEYARKISFQNDFRIILRTPFAMIFQPAATEKWRKL